MAFVAFFLCFLSPAALRTPTPMANVYPREYSVWSPDPTAYPDGVCSLGRRPDHLLQESSLPGPKTRPPTRWSRQPGLQT